MHPERPFNSWDALKILALLLMFADHAGAYFLLQDLWLRAVGRGAAPIFLFLVGYARSYRFSWEILALACLMTLSNVLMGKFMEPLNILYTILLCRFALRYLDLKGKDIRKPWEWFVALSVFALFSNVFTEYGTMGMLFAVSGYINRRPERYSLKTRQCFLMATCVVYAFMFVLLFEFPPADILLMIAVLIPVYLLLSRFTVRPLDTSRLPGWLVRALTLMAHYSGYIYALHLIALSWISGYPI